MKNKLLSLMLAIALMMSFCVVIVSATDADNQNVTYTVHEAYDYPVVPGTVEWNALTSLEEKASACAVDEDLMAAMTTSALLETVLNYPMLVNIYAFNSIEAGVRSVSKYFSGIQLLAEREDAVTCILQHTQAMTYAEDDATATVDQLNLRTLERYIQNLGISPVISTPGGSPVDSLYNLTWSNHGITYSEAVAAQNQYLQIFPNIRVISNPAPAYNCHSYAWYSTSTSNKYWINDPDIYMGDGSYTKTTSPAVGNKVYWSNSNPEDNHSAIVHAKSGSSITCISKWGVLGVYTHSLNDCPYSGAIGYWK